MSYDRTFKYQNRGKLPLDMYRWIIYAAERNQLGPKLFKLIYYPPPPLTYPGIQEGGPCLRPWVCEFV